MSASIAIGNAARAGAAACAWSVAAALPAAAAGVDCGQAHRWSADAGPYRVAFTPRPEALTVGRHFALELQLCAEAGAPAVKALMVDADMPAHRHGMNYQARVKRLAADRWRAEGLMLHMGGRWRFVIDLDTAAGPRRLEREIDVL